MGLSPASMYLENKKLAAPKKSAHNASQKTRARMALITVSVPFLPSGWNTGKRNTWR